MGGRCATGRSNIPTPPRRAIEGDATGVGCPRACARWPSTPSTPSGAWGVTAYCAVEVAALATCC
eukprot:7172761-Prymnesium_polylepis.1